MTKLLLIASLLLLAGIANANELGKDDKSAALNFKMKSLDGKDVDLNDYKGKVVLVVNVASRCGLTP
jgi:glutathione peroxidase